MTKSGDAKGGILSKESRLDENTWLGDASSTVTSPERRAEEMSRQTILLNGRSPKPPARVSIRKRR